MTKMIRCPGALVVVITLASAAAFAQSSGSATYIPKCGGCQGVNGIIVSAPARSMGVMDASYPYIKSLTASQMFSSVKNGEGRMPPFMNRLTDAQIRDTEASFRELGQGSSAPTPRAHGSNQFTIDDQSEFNAYAAATSLNDPAAKAAALEGFLQAYPNSESKKAALNLLMNIYRSLNNDQNALSTARRLLEADPNNMQAVFQSVVIKRSQCIRTSDAKTCDDAAELASRGLTMPKTTGDSDEDWRKQTAATYPIFHSAIAMDDALSKKDFTAAISEYRTELMLFSPDQTKSGPGLVDTLNLAEAYAKPDTKDLVQAVWFYSRAWNFAPPAYKAQIEPKIEYYYKKYHGGLDGLDEVKMQSAAAVFPPGTMVNVPAAPLVATQSPVPAERQFEDVAPPPPPIDAPPATIALGQTRDQVISAFGQPARIAKLGVKEIFYYKDMKVTITNGKVSNVE